MLGYIKQKREFYRKPGSNKNALDVISHLNVVNSSCTQEQQRFDEKYNEFKDISIFQGIDFKSEEDGRHIKRMCQPGETHKLLDEMLGLSSKEIKEAEKVTRSVNIKPNHQIFNEKPIRTETKPPLKQSVKDLSDPIPDRASAPVPSQA